MAATVKLHHVLLLIKDLPRSLTFYSRGLGLPIVQHGEQWAELDAGASRIALKIADSEAAATTGYSPFITFQVADLDACVQQMMMLGGSLDGPIKYPTHGKVAAMRSPDGHMIGLFEPL